MNAPRYLQIGIRSATNFRLRSGTHALRAHSKVLPGPRRAQGGNAARILVLEMPALKGIGALL
eukprot:15434141-Alexandrium_andersonii.AAC.1